MLIPLSASDVPAFTTACTHEHIFGSRILTALHTYGLGGECARFFLYQSGHQPSAALCLQNGVLTISSNECADPVPIAGLARNESVHEIDTNWAQCQALQQLLGGIAETSYYMVYRGSKLSAADPTIVPGELHAVFDVLQCSHEYYRTHLKFETWAADLTLRLTRGLSELYQFTLDGQVIGTGSIASEDEECGVIAAVAVKPEYRSRGFGSRITRFLIGRIQQKGKTPRLISGYDKVAELYRQLGFVPCGRWGELYL